MDINNLIRELEMLLTELQQQGVTLRKQENKQIGRALEADAREDIKRNPKQKVTIFSKIKNFLGTPLGKTILNAVPTLLSLI
jgi:hypothetical protein